LEVVNHPNANVTNREEADAFVLGLCLLSTGGGGLPYRGRNYLYELLDQGHRIAWTSPDEVDPDALTCSVFGMGSVAPHPPMSEQERIDFGIPGEAVARPGVKAVTELGEFLGETPTAIIPCELGGFNTIVAVDAAARLEATLVDGDYAGRAVPEMSMALPAALGYDTLPLAICDHWGNVLLMKSSPSPRVVERIGKMISTVTKAPDMLATCAHAAFPLRMRVARQAMVAGSLTKAMQLGKEVLMARAAGEDPIERARAHLRGLILFKGVIKTRDWQDRAGYMIGTTYLSGRGAFGGEEASVWFKNENHIFNRQGEIRATSPDLIAVVSDPAAEPLTNTELKEGMEVAILGFRCDDKFRSGTPLSWIEPRYFGFDTDYSPIEVLNPT
jgi:DUF917 family protein